MERRMTRLLPKRPTMMPLLCGMLLGGALLLTSASALPAEAATTPQGKLTRAEDPIVTFATPMPTPRPPRPKVPPPPEPPTFKPDVRVNYLGKSSSGAKTVYRFRVTNVGIGGAYDIGLDKSVGQRSFDGSLGTLQSLGGGQIDALETDQSAEVTVTCYPLDGYVCHSGSLKAMVTHDLDTANNHASSD